MVSDAKKRATEKYQKNTIVRKVLKLNKNTESDIIEWLESKENINGYLKELVRNDMNK